MHLLPWGGSQLVLSKMSPLQKDVFNGQKFISMPCRILNTPGLNLDTGRFSLLFGAFPLPGKKPERLIGCQVGPALASLAA